MRLVLAIAATIALPIAAAAGAPGTPPAPAQPPPQAPAPTPTQPAPKPAPTPPAPTPAPTSGDAPAAPAQPPGETDAEPKVDPAYGEKPQRDVRDFPAPRGKDVIIISYPDRSRTNITTLLALGGGGLVMGALGVYFNLDARSAAEDVSAQSYTGDPWTPSHQDTYERAERSSVLAGVFYGVGGALLLATAVAYIVTEPEAEKMVIQPHGTGQASRAGRTPARTPIVAPTRGGALVGGAWSF